ncbi:hypothetical protein ACVDFE_32825 [Lentzea chajnantorensis]
MPGSPTCTVLVTGRQKLASLIDRHGARHLPLGALTHEEARVLLAARLGADRVVAEPEAVDELIGLCGAPAGVVDHRAHRRAHRAVLVPALAHRTGWRTPRCCNGGRAAATPCTT